MSDDLEVRPVPWSPGYSVTPDGQVFDRNGRPARRDGNSIILRVGGRDQKMRAQALACIVWHGSWCGCGLEREQREVPGLRIRPTAANLQAWHQRRKRKS